MSVLAVVLGLAAAAAYGTSDFEGGLATKRASAVAVLVVSQAAGLLVGLVIVGVDRHGVASGSAMRLGALAGALGIAGLALLYTIAWRRRIRFDRRTVPLAITAGILEVVGNGAYIIAARNGFLSLVGVLGSLATRNRRSRPGCNARRRAA
jgi:hypothetical protein